jgi:uncharacterized damage-inducible protein DinB
MQGMQPLRTYDYLVLVRRRIFDWVRPLSAEQYSRKFPAWARTLGQTLTHIMVSEWYYAQRIMNREIPPYEEWPIKDENPPPFSEMERIWTIQAADIRAALSAVRDWNVELSYRGGEEDRPQMVTATAADQFTQLVIHEVHHRAQVLNMLRELGIEVGDLDFNFLMFKRQDIAAALPKK